MAYNLDVVAVVGSLRRESFTRRFTQVLGELAPQSLKIEIVGIGDLPLYNQDHDDDSPQASQNFRARIKRANGVLFATPEYNRSVPGVLKNAIDVGSRPEGKSVWAGKPAAIVSVTPYGLGAFGANHHLRQSLVFLNVPTLQQPEAYLSYVDKLFDEHGKLVSDGTGKFLQQLMQAFANWVETIRS